MSDFLGAYVVAGGSYPVIRHGEALSKVAAARSGGRVAEVHKRAVLLLIHRDKLLDPGGVVQVIAVSGVAGMSVEIQVRETSMKRIYLQPENPPTVVGRGTLP